MGERTSCKRDRHLGVKSEEGEEILFAHISGARAREGLFRGKRGKEGEFAQGDD